MSSTTRAAPATAGANLSPASSIERPPRTRRRALIVTASVTVAAFALFLDLLLVGHTVGEEIWGPITAFTATVVGLVTLAYLAVGGRSRFARVLLYALWAMVAFFGIGGFNDHRLPRSADTISDQRERPPLAPLTFTGIAIVGAVGLRRGSKGA